MQHVSLEAKPFGSFRLSVGFIFGFIFTLSFELTFERERDGRTDGQWTLLRNAAAYATSCK